MSTADKVRRYAQLDKQARERRNTRRFRQWPRKKLGKFVYNADDWLSFLDRWIDVCLTIDPTKDNLSVTKSGPECTWHAQLTWANTCKTEAWNDTVWWLIRGKIRTDSNGWTDVKVYRTAAVSGSAFCLKHSKKWSIILSGIAKILYRTSRRFRANPWQSLIDDPRAICFANAASWIASSYTTEE